MKKCISCGELQSLSNYDKATQNRDGTKNTCKTCVCKYNKIYWHNHKNQYRLHSRHWARANRAKCIEYQHKHNREMRAYREKWRKANPDKVKAHRIVRKMIKLGIIIKPKRCSQCFQEKRVYAHHQDYNKPLIYIWLCRNCHAETWQKPCGHAIPESEYKKGKK